MYLLDSDILIDYLRLYQPAINFLESLNKKERNISAISEFELLKGCSNKEQEVRINRFLKQFKILHLSEEIEKVALELFRKYRWSSGLGIADSLIAATCIKNKIPIVTRNIKHYEKIQTLSVHQAYF